LKSASQKKKGLEAAGSPTDSKTHISAKRYNLRKIYMYHRIGKLHFKISIEKVQKANGCTTKIFR